MTGPIGSTHRPSVTALDVFASLIVAFELAVAQPLLDLLGRNAEFFIARSSPVSDIVIIVLGIAIVVPVIGASIVLLVRAVHAPTGNALHVIGLGGLFGVLAVQIVDRLPVAAVAVIAIGAALGIGAAYLRSVVFRRVLRWALPLPLVVVGLALFGSELSKLVLGGSAVPAGVQNAAIHEPAPVVFITFDEFPTATLMDDRYRIDGRLFPNFARLAKDATWFRNTTAVGEFTDKAAPPILTGMFPDNSKLPIASDHPNNVFTLLGRSYNVRAQEPITRLCPVAVCRADAPRIPASKRWRSLLSDLRVVALHLLLPEDLTERLPPINQGWGNFAAEDRGGLAKKYTQKERGRALRANFRAAVDSDRRAGFESFIASIEKTDRPTLWFSHSILPHGPWEFLPSGHNYPLPDGLPGRTQGNAWPRDEWLTAQAYKLHILQTQYVDTLVGKVIDRLRQHGLYERALIVITADHGGAFTPGVSRRSLSVSRTMGEIGYVPFFVKRPDQREGAVDDRPVYTMDVLPTIADVLGVTGLWKTDGASAFGKSNRAERRFNNNSGRIITLPNDDAPLRRAVDRKFSVFARVGHSLDPWRTEPFGEMLGRKIGAFEVAEGSGGSIDRLRKEDGESPSIVTGTVKVDGPRFLAVAVDGVVRAITRNSFERFAALLPTAVIERGSTLELFVIEDASRFRRIGRTTATF